MDEDADRGLRGPLVGTSAILVRGGRVLMGRRLGAHGHGDWAFPGGMVEPGEDPAATAARELLEETGLVATSVEPLRWTSHVFTDLGAHVIALHHRVEATGDPAVLEPDKVESWAWIDWDAPPDPLFASAAALRASGWRP